jgi:hypothetical protein
MTDISPDVRKFYVIGAALLCVFFGLVMELLWRFRRVDHARSIPYIKHAAYCCFFVCSFCVAMIYGLAPGQTPKIWRVAIAIDTAMLLQVRDLFLAVGLLLFALGDVWSSWPRKPPRASLGIDGKRRSGALYTLAEIRDSGQLVERDPPPPPQVLHSEAEPAVVP